MENNIVDKNDERLMAEQKGNFTAIEYLVQKINGSGIPLHLSKEQMKEILACGKEVQKMSVKYGTNLDILVDDENSFNGYGTYVVSVNEDNARQLGIKIASRKYGGTFYIKNQPLSDFLQEKKFSSYWSQLVSNYKDNSVDNLSHEILSADVKGNVSLEREQNTLSTLLSLDLVEYKREQTFLYSVNIPDNDNTNYLLYHNPVGIEHAQKINEQLEKLGTSWRVSRNDIGKNIYFNVLSRQVFDGNQKKSSEFLKNLGYVGMQMDDENYIMFNDKDMSITDRVQFMKDVNGEVYGFTFEGQIYVDEDLVNSNVLAHEYTHIWDKYVQNNNPELWQRGKDVLKGTSLWQKITEDKNYENLKNDDEILSECHARIVGKMAEQILERIEREDGGLTRDRVIDWDKEVSQYIAEEFNIKPELGSENYVSDSVKAEYLKDFLSKPMKNLMNEVALNKKDLTPGQTIVQTSTQKAVFPSPISTQFPITEPNPKNNNTVNLKNNQLRSVKKLSKINTEIIQPREFLIKIKESFGVPDVNHSGYVENTVDNKKYVLRLSNHSINTFYVRNKIQETSLVIKLSEHDFVDHKYRLVKEYVYFPENLTKDVKDNIVKGLVDWVNTGTYSYDKADEINISSDYEKETSSKIQKMAESIDYDNDDYTDPIEMLEELHNGKLDEIIEDSLDKYQEQLRANGGISEAAMEAEIAAQETPKPDYLDEYGNPHWFDEEEPDYDDGQIPLQIVARKEYNFYNSDEVSFREYIIRTDTELYKELLPDEYSNVALEENAIPCIVCRKSVNPSSDNPHPTQFFISKYEDANLSEEEILEHAGRYQTREVKIDDSEAIRQMNGLVDWYEKELQKKIEHKNQETSVNIEHETVTPNHTNEVHSDLSDIKAEEIYSILERFSKIDSNEWKVSPKNKIAIFHLIDVTRIKDSDPEQGILNLNEYFKTEEFEREKESYLKILEPLVEKTITKGEIKSILDNDFTGNNVKLTQDFQNELIEKGIVKPEEKFVLINENEAVANGTKIKPDEPYVTLTIPVNNNGKTEFVSTKYYHVSSLEEPQKLEKSELENSKENTDKNVIIYGKTKVPEFAMITQHGLENFKDMIIESFDENSKSYLLKSKEGETNVRISENTLKELASDQYRDKTQSYSDDTAMADKMVEAQYNDFFQVRDNCANNFRHNLSVFCRKEANSPLDALKVANSLVSQMPKDEKRKTKELLNLLRKDGQTVNEVIIETYHEAVKEVPLNEDYLKNKRYDKMIARPMYDTISTKGEKIDRDFNLRI